jgi:hypothetical protein
MNGTVEVRTYAEQLRDELVQAATRQHRARRRRRAVVGAGAGAVALAGVIALLVGLLVSPSEDPASAEGTVRVVREDQSTLVEIVDIDRPDEVVADLRAIGLEVSRTDRRTGPSRVGKVVSFVVDTSRPTTNIDAFFSAYVEAGTHVEVGVGVDTPRGEGYDIGTDAFADGETLHCLSWPGQPTAELASVARANNVDLLVVDRETGPVDGLPAGGVVISATALSIDRVQVLVGEGAVAGPPVGCGTPSTGG